MKSLRAPLLLAAGILVATAISLRSERSLLWALAGPAMLSATIVFVSAMERRSRVTAMVIAIGLFLSAAIVAVADASHVSMMMPILGACSVAVLLPQRLCAAARS